MFNESAYPSVKDYQNPAKDYILPDIPTHILQKLNKISKPLVLKRIIIEKNKLHHDEISIEEYNEILYKGIENTDLVLKTSNDDYYYNFIHFDEVLNIQILIELSENKNQYEIVNFYKLSKKSLKNRIKKALKKELITRCGQFLITES